MRPSDYLNILRKLAEFARNTGVKNIESGDPLFPLDYNIDTNITGGYCITIAGFVLVVSPSGDVYFCCAKREKMYNLFDIMKKQIPLNDFHKARLGEYISSFPKLSETCVSCDILKKCRAGCIARRDYSSDGVDYYCMRSLMHTK